MSEQNTPDAEHPLRSLTAFDQEGGREAGYMSFHVAVRDEPGKSVGHFTIAPINQHYDLIVYATNVGRDGAFTKGYALFAICRDEFDVWEKEKHRQDLVSINFNNFISGTYEIGRNNGMQPGESGTVFTTMEITGGGNVEEYSAMLTFQGTDVDVSANIACIIQQAGLEYVRKLNEVVCPIQSDELICVGALRRTILDPSVLEKEFYERTPSEGEGMAPVTPPILH